MTAVSAEPASDPLSLPLSAPPLFTLSLPKKKEKKFFLMFIHFFERQSVSGGVAEREGDTESEADSRLPAVSTEANEGLEPRNCEIRP